MKCALEIAKSTARLGGLIMRTFISQDPTFYINFYNAIVVPKLSYCSPVWCPTFLKDQSLLETVQRKLVKRVARRCNAAHQDIRAFLQLIADIQIRNDTRAFKFLIRPGEWGRASKLSRIFFGQAPQFRHRRCPIH